MTYISEEEKARSRKLWEEAFPQDTRDFVDYYYKEKVKDNQIRVREEDGRIIAMLHENPYRIMVKNQIWRSAYIVGVATAEAYRHQGHMKALLTEMMEEMYQEGRQFCFLMPADPKIYEPFQFTYIFDQPQWGLKEKQNITRVAYDLEKGLEHHPLQEIADWMNAWLHSRYEVYAFRDEAYLARLMKELASEQGDMNLLYNDDRMVGVECFWGIKEREQRMLLCDAVYTEEIAPPKPAIMARIIHLQNFMKMIRLRKACDKEEVSLRIWVSDSFCKENEGAYLWNLTHSGSTLEKQDDSQKAFFGEQGGLVLTIDQLTAWLFGYVTPTDSNLASWIQPLDGVFLDEIV